MNDELKKSVNDFIKANVRRIQIALAIAIIRSKPEGITAVKHAANIQAQFRLKYSNSIPGVSDKVQPCNEKTVFLQQRRVMSQLMGLLPQSSKLDIPLSESQQLLSECSPDLFESEEFDIVDHFSTTNKNEDCLITEEEEFNLDFIQAMIQLKNVISTSSYFSVCDLQDVFSKLSTKESSENTNTDSHSSHSTQSNIGIVNTQSGINFGFGVNEKNSFISQGALKYIIHSSDTNILLAHSVKVVLQHLQKNITGKGEDLELVIENWKGSVLEDSLNSVLELVDTTTRQGEIESRTVCQHFIREMVENILSAHSLNMHQTWRYQCRFLTEFGNSEHLCSDFIEYLICKVSGLCKIVKKNASSNNTSVIECTPDDIEKSYFLFYMLENLFKKWKVHIVNKKKKISTVSESCQDTNAKVKDLWRKSWTGTSTQKENATFGKNECEEETKMMHWKDELEEMIITFSESYPFVSYYIWNCVTLLRQCIAGIQTTTENSLGAK